MCLYLTDTLSSASDLSEIGEELRTDDGISRTSGSSSIDLGPNENGPADDTSSIHAVSSQGGNQVGIIRTDPTFRMLKASLDIEALG